MVSKFVAKIVIAAALVIAVTATSGIVDDVLGLDVTPQVYACGTSSSGGGC